MRAQPFSQEALFAPINASLNPSAWRSRCLWPTGDNNSREAQRRVVGHWAILKQNRQLCLLNSPLGQPSYGANAYVAFIGVSCSFSPQPNVGGRLPKSAIALAEFNQQFCQGNQVLHLETKRAARQRRVFLKLCALLVGHSDVELAGFLGHPVKLARRNFSTQEKRSLTLGYIAIQLG